MLGGLLWWRRGADFLLTRKTISGHPNNHRRLHLPRCSLHFGYRDRVKGGRRATGAIRPSPPSPPDTPQAQRFCVGPTEHHRNHQQQSFLGDVCRYEIRRGCSRRLIDLHQAASTTVTVTIVVSVFFGGRASVEMKLSLIFLMVWGEPKKTPRFQHTFCIHRRRRRSCSVDGTISIPFITWQWDGYGLSMNLLPLGY